MFYHLFLSANFTKRCWSNGTWDTSKLDVDGIHILMNYSACKAASKDKVGNRVGFCFFLFWIETRIENFYTSVYVMYMYISKSTRIHKMPLITNATLIVVNLEKFLSVDWSVRGMYG